MAVTLNANTSTGFIATSDTSGVLQLQTGGTTALAVSAAQVVTLTNPLPVASGGSGGTTSTGTGANVLGTTPSFTSTIGVGGATASASGAGITFPVTQSASSNAKTLDDYEEGTYTPTVSYSGSTSGITYASRTGSFTKIGNVISVQIAIAINNKGTGSGSVVVSLPFANRAERAGLAIGNTQGISANNSSYQAMVEASLANVYFRVPSGLGSTTELGYADINNSFYVVMSGVYLIS